MLDILLALLMAINVALGGVAGNIDLDNRIVVVNEDNSFSTEASTSIGVDGYEILIPTVVNCAIVSENEAVEHFFATGEHLGMFVSWQLADAYAEVLHIRQEIKYGQ